MYEGGGVVLGASTTTAGVLALPNTGGHSWLTVVAVTSIAVGAAIVLSTVARLVVKHLPKV
jgi:hypothetical protein